MIPVRQVYMLLSPRSLTYAREALESLFRNVMDTIHLHLVTDSKQDQQELADAVARLDSHSHQWTVHSEEDLAAREEELFLRYDNLRAFRHGHPCWRKITDPLLLSNPAAEMVILDPDLYFPNRFRFEETNNTGVQLMWQRPNCLLPPEVVKTAMSNGIPLAHHVDIGVAHWRAAADLDWMNWLLGTLGGKNLPRVMHVEAIVWSALAMRSGGGYLDPVYWRCWHRTQKNRILRKMGASGVRILRSEPWNDIKCFHAGGEAKWWIKEAREKGLMNSQKGLNKPGRLLPFVELTPSYYARELALKRVIQALGYYQIFRPA
jgi:hypothetical protein